MDNAWRTSADVTNLSVDRIVIGTSLILCNSAVSDVNQIFAGRCSPYNPIIFIVIDPSDGPGSDSTGCPKEVLKPSTYTSPQWDHLFLKSRFMTFGPITSSSAIKPPWNLVMMTIYKSVKFRGQAENTHIFCRSLYSSVTSAANSPPAWLISNCSSR